MGRGRGKVLSQTLSKGESMALKLLIHVPEASRFKVGLNMAVNFLNTAGEGESLEARLLVNAQGVSVLLSPEEVLDKVKEFLEKGGEIYFCENALRLFEIPREKVLPGCQTVPAGIRVLVEWQEEGFRYVRA